MDDFGWAMFGLALFGGLWLLLIVTEREEVTPDDVLRRVLEKRRGKP